jgi:hypothetical protein
MLDDILHTHPIMECKLGLDKGLVIVDKSEIDKTKKLIEFLGSDKEITLLKDALDKAIIYCKDTVNTCPDFGDCSGNCDKHWKDFLLDGGDSVGK